MPTIGMDQYQACSDHASRRGSRVHSAVQDWRGKAERVEGIPPHRPPDTRLRTRRGFAILPSPADPQPPPIEDRPPMRDGILRILPTRLRVQEALDAAMEAALAAADASGAPGRSTAGPAGAAPGRSAALLGGGDTTFPALVDRIGLAHEQGIPLRLGFNVGVYRTMPPATRGILREREFCGSGGHRVSRLREGGGRAPSASQGPRGGPGWHLDSCRSTLCP